MLSLIQSKLIDRSKPKIRFRVGKQKIYFMSTAQKQPDPLEMTKKLIQYQKGVLIESAAGAAAHIKGYQTRVAQRNEIIKKALSKEFQTALAELEKLSLKEAGKKRPAIAGKFDAAATPAPEAARKSPAPRDHKRVAKLQPYFASMYSNSAGLIAEAYNPATAYFAVYEESNGLDISGNSYIQLFWWYAFNPAEAHIDLEYIANTNSINGFYELSDGGWSSGANAFLWGAISVIQDNAYLPGTDQQLWSQNSNGGAYSSPQGINWSFQFSCNNTPPSSDMIYVCISEQFDVNTNSGFIDSAQGLLRFNEGGNYVSAPTLTVNEAPV